MGYTDEDEDLPEAPPIQMILETFSQITSKPENNNKDNDKD